MKLNADYSSDISSLLDLKRNDSFFISTWNKDEEILPFPNNKIDEYNKLASNQANTYFFSDELVDMKNYIISENKEFEISNITTSNFTFVSNGTIAAWLSILTVLREKKHIRALLLSPVYYIYIEILKQLNIEIFIEPVYDQNIDNIISTIMSQNINLVIINNPLFGTGVCVPNKNIKMIQLTLLKTDGCILIDNIYNGLKWNQTASLNDFELYNFLSCNDNFIILESLAKNLFLNGIKHCSIFSHSKWLNKIEQNSVFFCGSITAQQYNYIKRLYSKKEHQFVTMQLTQNIDYARNNYHLLSSILTGKNVCISQCISGVYCLLGIPKNKFDTQNDLLIATEIMKKCNILTLPHDRYLYKNDNFYCFRINLMTKSQALCTAIDTLQKCFDF